MTRAISRDSFNELKQYLAVHLQQGRVLLDSDWNEGQDIMATLIQRLGQDAIGEGITGDTLKIEPALPRPGTKAFGNFIGPTIFPSLLFLQRFPSSPPLDRLDSIEGWSLSSPGNLQTSRDRPHDGKTFLRLSGHADKVTLTKTLPEPIDLSHAQFLHFRFRFQHINSSSSLPGTGSFFIEDSTGRRNTWTLSGATAGFTWTPFFTLPLDQRFSIVEQELAPAFLETDYVSAIVSIGAPGTVTWSSTPLPTGISLTALDDTNYAHLRGTPAETGKFNITITATSGASSVSRSFVLVVAPFDLTDTPSFSNASLANAVVQLWDVARKASATGPNTANLASITKYGFQLSQDPAFLIWDFGAIYAGSYALARSAAANNFIISGAPDEKIIESLHMLNFTFGGNDASSTDTIRNLLRAPRKRPPRAHVGGLPCIRPRDVLYLDQSDPNDPPLLPPAGGRTDLIYLDVWSEPITYVEDPDIREIALGGPDSATRMRLRQRVRVAQGEEGLISKRVPFPEGNGTGEGTLSTEGVYTDQANRLYLVEVDTAGDIGTATVRWSEDNGSTIQRVLESLPPRSTSVKVEDASAFQPGDRILLRKEFGDEEHRVAVVSGNVITLQQPTGAQLAQLPAGQRNVPEFTTFALDDHPKIQRWNEFHAPIIPDPDQPFLSMSVELSHGIKVRFSGKGFKKGDFWTFRARGLAGEDATGVRATTHIEPLDFSPPQGVVHAYLPLAEIPQFSPVLDPEPELIRRLGDLRPRAGTVVRHKEIVLDVLHAGPVNIDGGHASLGTTSESSMFLGFWSVQVKTNPGTVISFSMGLKDSLISASTSITASTADSTYTFLTVCQPPVDKITPPLQITEAVASIFVTSPNVVTVKGSLQIIEVKEPEFTPPTWPSR